MKLWVKGTWVLMSALSSVACTKKSEPALHPSETLYLQLSGEPVTLDPSRVEDGLGFRIVVNTMDGLMGHTNAGHLEKRLAGEARVSADRKEYTFQIRSGAQWSDGHPVTADQVQFALERSLLPATGSKLSGLLRDIEGAQDFISGKSKSLRGVTAEGQSLTVRLSRPVSYFQEVFALPITYPIRKEVLERVKSWDPLRIREIPSSGSYRISEHQRDQQIVLTAVRPLPKGAPKNVVLRIVQDETTGARLFEQGKIDILTRIPSYDQDKYEKTGQVRNVPFLATYFLSFNFRKPPFDRPEYRRAVAGAIRKGDLVKALGTGEAAATSWVPHGLPGSLPVRLDSSGRDPVFSESVARVKGRALQEKLTLAFDSSGRNSMLMERVQADLQEALGWKIELKGSDWKSHVREIFSDPASIYRYGWSSPMQDPIIFLSAFQTGDPFSFSGYSNPKYDRLVDEIRGMLPGAARTVKILQAQKLLVEEEAIVVPLYHYVSTFVVGSRIARYETNPFGHTLFEEVRLRR